MIENHTTWLHNQTANVRAELDNLLAYHPEPEFIEQLAELLPVVPVAGLIDLYYDIFYCCRPVFRIAARQLHSPEELSSFLALAERALANTRDSEAFTAGCRSDDVDTVITWLKRHAAAPERRAAG